jgi:hypothetical protein
VHGQGKGRRRLHCSAFGVKSACNLIKYKLEVDKITSTRVISDLRKAVRFYLPDIERTVSNLSVVCNENQCLERLDSLWYGLHTSHYNLIKNVCINKEITI